MKTPLLTKSSLFTVLKCKMLLLFVCTQEFCENRFSYFCYYYLNFKSVFFFQHFVFVLKTILKKKLVLYWPFKALQSSKYWQWDLNGWQCHYIINFLPTPSNPQFPWFLCPDHHFVQQSVLTKRNKSVIIVNIMLWSVTGTIKKKWKKKKNDCFTEQKSANEIN